MLIIDENNKKDISFSNGVDVLSLFDGMACGMLAMQGAGLKVNNYYAYEIDKYAIKTVLHNFPEVQELGEMAGLDILILIALIINLQDGLIDYLNGLWCGI